MYSFKCDVALAMWLLLVDSISAGSRQCDSWQKTVCQLAEVSVSPGVDIVAASSRQCVSWQKIVCQLAEDSVSAGRRKCSSVLSV